MTLTWSTALPDWRERIVAGHSLLPPGLPLFPDEAEAGLEVFRDLPLVDVLGKPTFGEISRDWVFDLPKAVFGAYNPANGRREINEFFELIAKKNTKSTRAAGIMVTELVRNERFSAEFAILAPTIEVAKNSAEPAMDFVAEHPELRRILKPIAHQRLIRHLHTGAELKILAADKDTVAGGKFTGLLFDEWWLFGKRPNARHMIREAIGGLASRPEGFVIKLTTQGDEPPTGVFLDDLKRFRDIRDGKLHAPRALGFLYEYPEEMIKSEAYKDFNNFYIPNPNMGVSVDEDFLRDQYEIARREGQHSLVSFFAKHGNVEPGMGARADSWAGAEFWKRRDDASVTLDSIIARCEVVVIGIDGGGLDDLYGLTVLGREPTTVDVAAEDAPEATDQDAVNGRKQVKRWLSWSHAWAHRILLERRKGIATKLEELALAGELTMIDDRGANEADLPEDLRAIVQRLRDAGRLVPAINQGLPADLAGILNIVGKVKDAGLLCCVACDPASLGELIEALATIGVEQDNDRYGRDYVAGVPQGFALMNAIKTSERKLANGSYWHASQKLMDWCVANLKIEPTATAIRATKVNAGDAKIDPAMAKFNAAFVMATNPEATRSAYEGRGLLVL